MTLTTKILKTIALAFLFEGIAMANTKIPDDKLRKIQMDLKNHNFLTVDFEIDTYSALRDKHKIETGEAFFKKPDQFRWNFNSSDKQLLFNGKEMFQISTSVKKAERMKMSDKGAEEVRQIIDMVLNLDKLFEKYDHVSSEMQGEFLNMEIKPKNAQTGIVKGTLVVDTKKNFIELVKLHFDKSKYTAYKFKNAKRENIANSQFELDKSIKVKDAI